MIRKVNQKVLFWNTVAYRVCVILETGIFLWLFGVLLQRLYGIDMASIEGGLLMSIAWNIINMITYWVWHYYFFKWFKVGAGDHVHELEDTITRLEKENKLLKGELK